MLLAKERTQVMPKNSATPANIGGTYIAALFRASVKVFKTNCASARRSIIDPASRSKAIISATPEKEDEKIQENTKSLSLFGDTE